MPVPGRNVAVLVDEFNMSAYFNEFEFEREAEDIDVSTFGKLQRSYLSGPQETTITLTGFYDGGALQVDEVFHNRFGLTSTDMLITLCPDTAVFGKSCYVIPTTQVNYNLSAEVEDAVELEAEFRANGALDRGVILHAEVNEAVTANHTAVDNTVATTKGGTVHLHVIAGTVGGTTPSVNIKVQHSVDNSVWNDLVTMTGFSVAGPISGKERKLTATATDTVNRYTRAVTTIVGASSNVTYVLAFARGI